MCGIGGFSLTKDSKIRPRMLSNALLTALEDRGYMASGIAWHGADGSTGWHKGPVPGSGLALKTVPKNINVGIVHTRLATHGSVEDNRNNHPVQSPSKNISLVHNGVIYNHNQVRSALSNRIKFEVDTAVIPALLEENQHDLTALKQLDGDAAIAWLRDDDPNVLRVARLEHSPLVICQVEDGSFIFASTESLLWKVLIQMDLMPEFIQSVDEYTYLQVEDGVIKQMMKLERPVHYSSKWDYSYYRHQTAGAKGSKPSGNPYIDETDPFGWSAYDDFGDDYWDYAIDKHSYKSDDGEYLTDFYGKRLQGKPAYYIRWVNTFVDEPTDVNTMTGFYATYDYENYEDDCSTIKRLPNDYQLVDHGVIDDDGTFVSAMTPSDSYSCELF